MIAWLAFQLPGWSGGARVAGACYRHPGCDSLTTWTPSPKWQRLRPLRGLPPEPTSSWEESPPDFVGAADQLVVKTAQSVSVTPVDHKIIAPLPTGACAVSLEGVSPRQSAPRSGGLQCAAMASGRPAVPGAPARVRRPPAQWYLCRGNAMTRSQFPAGLPEATCAIEGVVECLWSGRVSTTRPPSS